MMNRQPTLVELDAAMPGASGSPHERGTLEMIVARPGVDERLELTNAQLDRDDGLVGDGWRSRGSSQTVNGRANPDAQITLMNSRVIQLLTGERAQWQWAGDQLFVDLDLSEENLPAGTRLAIGTAVLEVTELPHTGCAKFAQRFGADALRYVNSPVGRRLRRRGMYARVVQAGAISTGDTITRLT